MATFLQAGHRRSGEAPLPLQRQTGLAQESRVADFSGRGAAIISLWDQQKPHERVQAISALANENLKAVGVVYIGVIADPFGGKIAGGSTHGAFVPAAWTIFIKPESYNNGKSREEIAALLATVYHEARHAEQFFRMARMIAAESGHAVKSIQQELGLPEDVASAAAEAPLSGPTSSSSREHVAEYEEATAWRNAYKVYAALREILQKKKDAYHAATEKMGPALELMELAQAGTPGVNPEAAHRTFIEVVGDYREARAQYQQAYKAYHTIAVEEDAWALGGRIQKALGQKPSTYETMLEALGPDARTVKVIGSGEKRNWADVVTPPSTGGAPPLPPPAPINVGQPSAAPSVASSKRYATHIPSPLVLPPPRPPRNVMPVPPPVRGNPPPSSGAPGGNLLPPLPPPRNVMPLPPAVRGNPPPSSGGPGRGMPPPLPPAPVNVGQPSAAPSVASSKRYATYIPAPLVLPPLPPPRNVMPLPLPVRGNPPPSSGAPGRGRPLPLPPGRLPNLPPATPRIPPSTPAPTTQDEDTSVQQSAIQRHQVPPELEDVEQQLEER